MGSFGLGFGIGGGLIFHGAKISLFAALHETFSDGFQFFPAATDVGGFTGDDLVVGNGGGDDSEEVGEFLDYFVGGGNEKFLVGIVRLGILDEEPAVALAEPLDDAQIAGAFLEGVNAIEGIGGSTADGGLGWLSPFVNHGEREAQLGGDLFGAAFLKNFAQ
jgi:hypothetical protein